MGRLIPARGTRRAVAALLLGIVTIAVLCSPAVADETAPGDVAAARARTVTQRLGAYGQIEPIAVVRVRTVDAGTVSGLRVVPGSVVRAGQVLARLGGAHAQALLATREQGLLGARARELAASRVLESVRRQYAAQLATRRALDAAQGELAAARAAAGIAEAQLREARDLQAVRAPVAGTVVELRAADGQQAAAGEALLTLQPAGKLWIRARYYGSDAAALRVGMHGRFEPADGGNAVAVRLAAIAPALAPDGALRVGLVPVPPASLATRIAGEWGAVELEGGSRELVEVPTSALILDRGRWWVLVHTPGGDEPRQVVPGPSHGWSTSIASGLQPGQQVVVTDAFLRYHRGIARAYAPPD